MPPTAESGPAAPTASPTPRPPAPAAGGPAPRRPARTGTVTPAFLRRTRPLSVAATVLLCFQLFGNLYEEVVTNAQNIADPRPGGLVGELDFGSPLFYYLPWVPLGLAAAVALRIRHGRTAPRHVLRAWNAALASLGVAVAAKVVLITQVNPVFRDPSADAGLIRDRAVLWAFGNGVAIAAVAAALILLTAWRRPTEPEEPPAAV